MAGKVKKTMTNNDAVSMAHKDRASSLRAIADHIEKWESEYTVQEIIDYLRELADGSEAQSMVVDLRDECGFSRPKE